MSPLPAGLLQRLRDYWPYGKHTEPPPPLSTGVAVFLSILFSLSYVTSLYLSPTTRPSQTITRDSPTVVKARVRAVLLACSLCTVVTIYILSVPGRLPYYETLHLLGLWPISIPGIARSMALIMTLFAGPLFECLVVEESWREYVAEPKNLIAQLFSPIGMRNYIAGPFTEELLFRSLLIPLNMLSPQVTQASTGLAGTHARLVLFTTPLYFGVAHIHHLYEFRVTRPNVPFKFALIQSLFQLCFTTVFGWYAAFVFLRTGSFWACVLTHSFCNWMGLPRLFGRVQRRKPHASSSQLKNLVSKVPVAMGPPKDEPGARGSDDNRKAHSQTSKSFVAPLPGWNGLKRDADDVLGADGNGKARSSQTATRARSTSYVRSRGVHGKEEEDSVLWTVAYYAVLVAGMVGFYRNLWSWTANAGQLADI